MLELSLPLLLSTPFPSPLLSLYLSPRASNTPTPTECPPAVPKSSEPRTNRATTSYLKRRRITLEVPARPTPRGTTTSAYHRRENKMASGTRSSATVGTTPAAATTSGHTGDHPAGPAAAPASTATASPRLHLPPPPPFSGVGQDLEQWLATLRRVGPAHGWRPQDDAVVIPALLTGTAAVWYDQLTDQTKHDATALRAALLAAFGRPSAATSAREALYSRRQRAGETVTELAVAVGELCHRVDPNMADTDRAQLLQQACHPELRRLLAATLKPDASWDATVSAARRIEASTPRPPTLPDVKFEANAIGDPTADLHRRIDALEARLATAYPNPTHAASTRPPTAPTDSRTDRRGPTCERCGKFGHHAAVCRAPAPLRSADRRDATYRHEPFRPSSFRGPSHPDRQPGPSPYLAHRSGQPSLNM